MSDTESRNMKDLAAAFNNYQITDEEGMPKDEQPSIEETAPQEEVNTVEETASSEKSAEPEAPTPKVEDEETETQLAEDETGKRYVPESRFKEVYAKQKQLERELEKARKSQPQYQAPVLPVDPTLPMAPKDPTVDHMELEMLFEKFPQFNPETPEYSRTLDEMGAEIKAANPSMTRLQAAKMALARAKELTANQAQIAAEARQIKIQSADQGITSRSTGRGQASTPDFNSMSDIELEKFLRESGQW